MPAPSLDGRTFADVTADAATASGQCHSVVEVLDDGRLRMHETWRWESRHGTGTSTVEELAPGDR